MRVLWHWYSMGPYHFARMEALARQPGIDLTVVESTSCDDHGWQRAGHPDLNLISLSSGLLGRRVVRTTTTSFGRVLEEVRPDVIVAPGYADPYSLRKLIVYKTARPQCSLLLWSETTEVDHSRKWLGETVKSRLLSVFDGAFVAGTSHALYLQRLGLRPEKIEVLGNCVDNGWFSRRAEQARGASLGNEHGLPGNYFLFVGRLIREKNVGLLIDSYVSYRHQKKALAWDLVIVGSGPEEQTLRKRAAELPAVHFVGSKQPDDLPPYYANASCLVLPSSSEPWGLVVNEAMASGVPVIVSNKCGCATDLLRHGENGFAFDPGDPRALANLMIEVAHGNVNREEIAARAVKTVSMFSPESFAAKASRHMTALREHALARPTRTLKTACALALIWERVF